jgi:serine/threonine-protein kinase
MSEELRGRRIRALFDAVCELPEPRWAATLQGMCDDAGLIEETLGLLRAQTVALGRLQQSLDAVFGSMDDPASQVGRRLGPWRLSRLLASGGMGMVFLAERADQLYRRQVAIKLMRRAYDPVLAARLAAESQILADLQHPDIARLYDAGVAEGGQPYLVMEYVEGQPLDVACEALQLDLRQRLQLFERICRAVQAAHSQLVVHCDLKPGNVLVRADRQPVLLDFGISRLLGDSGGEADFATPAYASPERLAGRPANVASDIFSLGIMLTELLTTRPLRREVTDAQQPVPTPAELAPPECPWRSDLRGDLGAIAAKACTLAPADRYASAEALADDVERYLQRYPVRARPVGRVHHVRLFLRRRWRESLAASAVMIMAMAFVLRLSEARRNAEENAAAASNIADFLVAAFDAADPGLRGPVPMSAREVLDLSARRIDGDLSASPALRARLQATLGRAYQNLGQPKEAETLLRQGVDGLARAGAAAHETAAAYVSLSAQLGNAHRFTEALDQAEHALRLLDKDENQAIRVQALTARGRAYAGTERYALAEASFQTALALSRDGEGPALQRGEIAVLKDLGDMYRAQGRLDRSEATLNQALKAASALHGQHGFEYQRALQALSLTLFSQGRINESLALAERNFELTRRLFGSDNSYTASAEAALAGQYLDLGRYELSARHFRSSVETSARVDGPSSRAYASNLHAYGLMEEARGDYASAERLYRQALDIYRNALGHDHLDSLDVEMVLARLLLRTERTGEAAEPLQRVAAIWRRELPATSQQLIVLRLIEIEWMTRAGHYADATSALQAFVAAHPSLPPGLMLRQQMQQALLAQRTGTRTAAELWTTVVATFSQLYGDDSTATAKWRIPLAESLLAQGDTAAARAEIERARPQLRELAPQSEFLRRIDALDRRLVAGAGSKPSGA